MQKNSIKTFILIILTLCFSGVVYGQAQFLPKFNYPNSQGQQGNSGKNTFAPDNIDEYIGGRVLAPIAKEIVYLSLAGYICDEKGYSTLTMVAYKTGGRREITSIYIPQTIRNIPGKNQPVVGQGIFVKQDLEQGTIIQCLHSFLPLPPAELKLNQAKYFWAVGSPEGTGMGLAG